MDKHFDNFPEANKTESIVIYKLGVIEANLRTLRESQKDLLASINNQHIDMLQQQLKDRDRIDKIEKQVSSFKTVAAVIGSVSALIWSAVIVYFQSFFGGAG